MTKCFIPIFFFFCIFLNAQNTDKVEPPKIITKLKIGENLNLGTKTLKFIGVKEDTRCPVDVNCFWEGQITITVGVYKKTQQLEEKEVTLKGKGGNRNTHKEILTTENKGVYLYNVTPYPASSTAISEDKYLLEVIVK